MIAGHQLNSIFAVIGTPAAEEIRSMKNINEEFKQVLLEMKPVPGKDLTRRWAPARRTAFAVLAC